MIAEFVDRRGGGLLMLGGRRSFAEGGYAGHAGRRGAAGAAREQRRAAGRHTRRAHRCAADARAARRIRSRRSARPRQESAIALGGAAAGHERQRRPPAQAGRDRAAERRWTRRAAIGRCSPITATAAARRSRCRFRTRWHWQMGAERRGRRHDARELLAAAAALAGRRRARAGRPSARSPERVEPGAPVTHHRRRRRPGLRRSQQRPRRRARHRSRGRRRTCRCSGPATATASTRRRSSPASAGVYETRVEASRDAGCRSATRSPSCVPRRATSEYFDATMRAPLLQRVADDTGGRFYTRDTISDAARGSQVHGPRRHQRRGAGVVGHAAVLLLLLGAHARRMGLSAAGEGSHEPATMLAHVPALVAIGSDGARMRRASHRGPRSSPPCGARVAVSVASATRGRAAIAGNVDYDGRFTFVRLRYNTRLRRRRPAARPRCRVGARLPHRRPPPDEDPAGADAASRRTSTIATS